MEYSSGIILYKKNKHNLLFFVCTPDGPYWYHRELWNFPKGHIENGETELDAAIREIYEETSILLNKNYEYKFLGHVKQNKNKKVAVFAKEYEGENTDNCTSNLCKTIYHGKVIEHNEIKSYAWMTYDELVEKGMSCYLGIFKMLEEEIFNIKND